MINDFAEWNTLFFKGNIAEPLVGSFVIVGIIVAYVANIRLFTSEYHTHIHPFSDPEWFTSLSVWSQSGRKRQDNCVKERAHQKNWQAPRAIPDNMENTECASNVGFHRFVIIVLLLVLSAFSIFLDACRTNCKIKLKTLSATEALQTTNKTEIAKLQKLQKALDWIFYCFCAICVILPVAWFFLFRFLNNVKDYLESNTVQTGCSSSERGESKTNHETILKNMVTKHKKWGCDARSFNIIMSFSLLIPIGLIVWKVVTNFTEMKELINPPLFYFTIVILGIVVLWLAIFQGLLHPILMIGRDIIKEVCPGTKDTKKERNFNMSDPAVYLMERML